jgi:hypothetical protein
MLNVHIILSYDSDRRSTQTTVETRLVAWWLHLAGLSGCAQDIEMA